MKTPDGMDGEGRARAYEEVVEFLYQEAQLLDQGQFSEWLNLLTDDIVYHMPVRLTRERSDKPDRSELMEHFSENLETLRLRVKRLYTDFAWAEDPPSRTRRFVSNVRLAPGNGEGEIGVRSYLLVYRNRGDAAAADLISAERHDVLKRVGGAWKLQRRMIVVDQATVGTRNLGIFF